MALQSHVCLQNVLLIYASIYVVYARASIMHALWSKLMACLSTQDRQAPIRC